jgi:hypothetical protein
MRTLILVVLVVSFVYAFDRGRYNYGGNNPYQDYGSKDQPASEGHQIAKHSFHSPFLFGATSTIPNWEYGGSAVATENFVRLVPAIRSRVGYIWNTEVIQFYTH